MNPGENVCADPAKFGVEAWRFVTVALFGCGCPRAWSTNPDRLPEGEQITMPAGEVLTAFAETARCHLVASTEGAFALHPVCRRHRASS